MPQRLTEALLQQGLIAQHTADEAMNRHVLMGGALDTCLLELQLVDESVLCRVLAEAYGMESLAPEAFTRRADEQAMRAFPQQWARKYTLAPLELSPDGLKVLTPAPADVDALRRLGDLLETKIIPVLAPEVRVRQRLEMLYGVRAGERFSTLLDRLDGPRVAEPRALKSLTEPPASPDMAEGATESGLQPAMRFGEAVSAVSEANRPHDIAETTVRYAGQWLRFVALLEVEGRSVRGWVGAGPQASRVADVAFDLNEESAFRVVVDTRTHYLGPVPSDQVQSEFLAQLHRSTPRTVFIAPIRTRNETVALLYADHGDAGVSSRLAADLMLFLTHVQVALEAQTAEPPLAGFARTGDLEAAEPIDPEALDETLTASPVPSDQGDELLETPSLVPEPAAPVMREAVRDDATDPRMAEPGLVLAPADHGGPELIAGREGPEFAWNEETDLDPFGPNLGGDPGSDAPLPLVAELASATPAPSVGAIERLFAPEPLAEWAAVDSTDELFIPDQPPPSASELDSADVLIDDTPPPPESLAQLAEAPFDLGSYSSAMVAENADGSDLVEALSEAPEPQAPRGEVGLSALPMEPPTPPEESGGWEAAVPDNWDEAIPEAPFGSAVETLRRSIIEDATVPDLSAEAWIRASSEMTRARPLPDDVVQRSELPNPDAPREPVPLTQVAVNRRTVGIGELPEPPAIAPRDRASGVPVPELVESPALPPGSTPFDSPAADTFRLEEVVEEVFIDDEHPPERDLADLLVDLVSTDPLRANTACEALVGWGPAIIPSVMERFPGVLSIDPFGVDVTLPAFARCGPTLALLERFGAQSHPFIVRYLDAPRPIDRFFAIYFYAAVYVPEVIAKLIHRLHDDENRVGMLAARTLFSYRDHRDFALVLEHLRGRASANSLGARRHAVFLMGVFRDVTAIPELIALLARRERSMQDVVENALAEITKQRLGGSAKKWRAWWAKNQGRSRIAWLLDGLAAKDADLRQSAVLELRAVTGMNLGFDGEAPRRQREEARQRWLKWWKAQQANRAVTPA